MKPPLSPSYKFEKEEGGEGLEEEEGEAAPSAVIPGSATERIHAGISSSLAGFEATACERSCSGESALAAPRRHAARKGSGA